ncbi:MAG: regulatory protein RecX [Clostridia bacterium]|nr:regulatory protein RecX [Oscillospiraceae bacterium]MBQ2828736.1 regulatory protein RecX [Clostridia bacterium]
MKLSTKNGRENKIHIFLDGEYSLTVDSEFWFTSRWCRIKEIDEEDLEELREDIEMRRAWLKALDLLSLRSHSQKELIVKLRRKYSQETAEAVAHKAAELGLIDDEAFAEMYARELIERKKYGISRVKNELRLKGISSHIIESVIFSLDFDSKESIINLVERKYARKLSDEKGRRQVIAALQRLGYSYSDIRAALSEFDISDETDEW